MSKVTVQSDSQNHAANTDDLGSVVVSLLKGTVEHERDPKIWSALLRLQIRVREYVQVLGLQLVLDEAEGHAFLKYRAGSEDETEVPRLFSRHQLSFQVSLLLALLRKKLAEFDATGGDTKLVLTHDEIVNIVRVFLPDGTNEAKLMNSIDRDLKKVVDLGFLRPMKSQSENDQRFEVLRILKTFVDGQWLNEFDARLAQYQVHLNGTAKLSENYDD